MTVGSLAAAPVAGGSGLGARRARADPQRAAGVAPADRAAAGADRVDVDHRQLDRRARRSCRESVRRTSPSSTTQTSQEVPPMSRPSALPSPPRAASRPAPTAPPAGPESTLQAPARAASAAVGDAAGGLHHQRPRQARARRRPRRAARGSGRAGARGRRRSSVVEQRSYSRKRGRTSCEAETWTSGSSRAQALGERAARGPGRGRRRAGRSRPTRRRPRGPALGQALRLALGQRLDDALRADPLGRLEAQLRRDQRRRASGRRAGRARAGPGGRSRAGRRSRGWRSARCARRVPRAARWCPTVIPWANDLDLGGLGARPPQHLLDRGHHARRLLPGRGRHLRRVDRARRRAGPRR